MAVTRVCQFTDTGEWYAGARTMEGDEFNQPIEEWATQIGEAHGRPVEGFEFSQEQDDPRTGTLVEDAPGDPLTSPDPALAEFTPDERKRVRELL
jgi:hypothetical protein